MKYILQISKLDAALRQLQTAILLYFNSRDPVSIHTLSAAAYNLLRDIRDSRKEAFAMSKDAGGIPAQYKKAFRDLISKSENFFKHADRDPNDIHLFRTQGTEILLIDACDAYIRMTGEEPEYIALFKRWHATCNPQYYKNDSEFYKAAMKMRQFYSENDRFAFFQDGMRIKAKI